MSAPASSARDEPRGRDAKEPTSKPRLQPTGADDQKTLPVADVEKRLGSSPEGLSQIEAAKRLVQYGPNEIEETKTNPHLKLPGESPPATRQPGSRPS